MPLRVVVLEPEGSRESVILFLGFLHQGKNQGKLAHQQKETDSSDCSYRLRDITR